MNLILNPKEAGLLNYMTEFFHGLGFHRDARRMGEKALEDYRKANAKRLESAMADQAALGVQNSKAKHTSVNGLGQVMRRMAPSLRHELRRLYGPDALKDESFLNRLNKDNPQFNFKPAYQGKTTIIKQ